MTIVGIEFDQSIYNNPVKCEKWLEKRPEYSSILTNKKWRLKTVAKSVWMSVEGRKVYAWYGPFYTCKELAVERPENSVVVFIRRGTSFYSEADIPALSVKFQRKRREADLAKELKDQKRLETEEKRKTKKRKSRATIKDPAKTFELTPAKQIGRRKKAPTRAPKKAKAQDLEAPIPISNDLPEFTLTAEEESQIKATFNQTENTVPPADGADAQMNVFSQ